MDLPLRLREATAELHGRIERLPAAEAMAAGRITRADYLALLGQLTLLHATLERELELHDALRVLYQSGMARLPVLHTDLAVLGGAPAARPWPATLALVRELQEWSAQRPWALLGSLYILEGSRMGSMVLVKPLSAALGVPPRPGQGLDYHLQGMADRPRAWQQFKAVLAALPLTDDQAEQVLAAAVRTMSGLHALYAALTAPDVCIPAAPPALAAMPCVLEVIQS
ncbi:MAG: biliverdin-producing heme oxygenase [Planctomycetia bacterium]|nr:biliverdin-producing heme oxygenase [Planctomycetia bacterium]